MESESGTSNTKISESGYSNSISNSQRSGSSKSRHSGSNSSRSSGYCGVPNGQESVENDTTKRNKDHKKKKQKTVPQPFTTPVEVPVVEDTIVQDTTEPPTPSVIEAEPSLTAPNTIESESGNF
ncbi:uncharacterized protein LOC143202451 [Rhynchophorus ferrugineus]|uniref:uncharacterized protein LOC143202451 n=1 Tax=Rhynchophorus ferrugineus TaxID=354439 RepID=UPI003FCEC088